MGKPLRPSVRCSQCETPVTFIARGANRGRTVEHKGADGSRCPGSDYPWNAHKAADILTETHYGAVREVERWAEQLAERAALRLLQTSIPGRRLLPVTPSPFRRVLASLKPGPVVRVDFLRARIARAELGRPLTRCELGAFIRTEVA